MQRSTRQASVSTTAASRDDGCLRCGLERGYRMARVAVSLPRLLLNAFPCDLPCGPPSMPHGAEPGLDLFLGEVPPPFALGQAREREGQWEEVEKLAIAPLDVGTLA